MDTWRNNNVIITPKRRRDVVLTLLLRRVPAWRPFEFTVNSNLMKSRPRPITFQLSGTVIHQSYKSHDAPVPYPQCTIPEQKCAHFCSELCIVGYWISVLGDLWNWFIVNFCQEYSTRIIELCAKFRHDSPNAIWTIKIRVQTDFRRICNGIRPSSEPDRLVKSNEDQILLSTPLSSQMTEHLARIWFPSRSLIRLIG